MLRILPRFFLLIAFVLIFLIEWYTPIHSDDYRYAVLGMSLDAHYHHYMTWSGRIVADLVSSALLVLDSRVFYAAMTALAVVLFCFIVVKTPQSSLKLTKSDVLLFPLIFLTYWIANPNIGETTFWIVGAANYLWTNLFAAAWIYGMYRIYRQNISKVQLHMVVLSLVAGCSTESIGPFIVLLAALAVAWDLWLKKPLSASKVIYLCFALAGAMILILSPGNFVRASGVHHIWYAKPLFERIAYHLTHRFFGHQALIWIAYAVLVLLGLVAFICSKRKVALDNVKTIMMWLMIATGIGTSLIMFASPTYPDRVMNGTFMFILFAISFLASNLLNTGDKYAIRGISCITLLLAGVMVWSYSLMLIAYKQVYQQDLVRRQIIAAEVAKNHRDFAIPDFHFRKMQNSGGQFGFFHDPRDYGAYFGADKIVRQKVGFDYSVLATGEKVVLDNHISAWFNQQGSLILVSDIPVEGQILVIQGDESQTLAIDTFKTAKMNQQYWYYQSIPERKIDSIRIEQ